MAGTQQPIGEYIAQLTRQLHLPAAERDEVLAEVRGHLEERAAALRAADTGLSEEQAERQAVHAFGSVSDISRQLRAAHPRAWGPSRWAAGLVAGAVVTWVLWLAGTAPALAYYFTLYPVYLVDPHGQRHLLSMSPIQTLIQSSPLASGAFYAYLAFGWLWLLPLLALYLVVPFVWGRRARRWWMPGLAYGLGTWLSAPWFALEVVRTSDWAFSAEGRILALALPLALVASYAGWRRQPRSASTVAPALVP
jgi:hypothetical protein